MAQTAVVAPSRTSRAPSFVDGRWQWTKQYDERDNYGVDVSDLLASGETCSSVTMVDVSGPTLTGAAVTAGGAFSVTVTSGGGTARARIVTSLSRLIYVPLRWRVSDRGVRDSYA